MVAEEQLYPNGGLSKGGINMKVYVDSQNCIHDVGSTENSSLRELIINDANNPFEGWTAAKICCYRVEVANEVVVSCSPYIPSSIVELIDRLAKENAELRTRANNTDKELDELLINVIPRMMN